MQIRDDAREGIEHARAAQRRARRAIHEAFKLMERLKQREAETLDSTHI